MVIVPFTRKRDLRGLKGPTLSEYTLQMTTQIKYLGLILEKELIWKGTVENVMNKAYSNFGTVRAYLVKPGV